MKIIFLTLAIYVHATTSTTKEYSTESRRSFENVIEEKCLENSHSKYAFQRLRDESKIFDQCQRKTGTGNIPHPIEQHEEFCRYFEESHFYSCMEDMANSALPCLDKSEVFFPRMMLEAYNTTFDTLCGTNGLRKSEYIFNKLIKNSICMREAFHAMVFTGSCIQNLTAYKNFMEVVVDLNQQDYCSDMNSFVDCATELVEQQCDANFSIFKFYLSDLFLSVCKNQQNFLRFG